MRGLVSLEGFEQRGSATHVLDLLQGILQPRARGRLRLRDQGHERRDDAQQPAPPPPHLACGLRPVRAVVLRQGVHTLSLRDAQGGREARKRGRVLQCCAVRKGSPAYVPRRLCSWPWVAFGD